MISGKNQRGIGGLLGKLKAVWGDKRGRIILCSILTLSILILLICVLADMKAKDEIEFNNEQEENLEKPVEISSQLQYKTYLNNKMVDEYICKYYSDDTHIIFKNNEPYKAYNACQYNSLFSSRIAGVCEFLDSNTINKETSSSVSEAGGQGDGEQYGLYKYKDTIKYRYIISDKEFNEYLKNRIKNGAEVLLIVEDYSWSEVYLKEEDGNTYRFIVATNYVIMGKYNKERVPSIDEYCNNELTEISDIGSYAIDTDSDNENEANKNKSKWR